MVGAPQEEIQSALSKFQAATGRMPYDYEYAPIASITYYKTAGVPAPPTTAVSGFTQGILIVPAEEIKKAITKAGYQPETEYRGTVAPEILAAKGLGFQEATTAFYVGSMVASAAPTPVTIYPVPPPPKTPEQEAEAQAEAQRQSLLQQAVFQATLGKGRPPTAAESEMLKQLVYTPKAFYTPEEKKFYFESYVWSEPFVPEAVRKLQDVFATQEQYEAAKVQVAPQLAAEMASLSAIEQEIRSISLGTYAPEAKVKLVQEQYGALEYHKSLEKKLETQAAALAITFTPYRIPSDLPYIYGAGTAAAPTVLEIFKPTGEIERITITPPPEVKAETAAEKLLRETVEAGGTIFEVSPLVKLPVPAGMTVQLTAAGAYEIIPIKVPEVVAPTPISEIIEPTVIKRIYEGELGKFELVTTIAPTATPAEVEAKIREAETALQADIAKATGISFALPGAVTEAPPSIIKAVYETPAGAYTVSVSGVADKVGESLAQAVEASRADIEAATATPLEKLSPAITTMEIPSISEPTVTIAPAAEEMDFEEIFKPDLSFLEAPQKTMSGLVEIRETLVPAEYIPSPEGLKLLEITPATPIQALAVTGFMAEAGAAAYAEAYVPPSSLEQIIETVGEGILPSYFGKPPEVELTIPPIKVIVPEEPTVTIKGIEEQYLGGPIVAGIMEVEKSFSESLSAIPSSFDLAFGVFSITGKPEDILTLKVPLEGVKEAAQTVIEIPKGTIELIQAIAYPEQLTVAEKREKVEVITEPIISFIKMGEKPIMEYIETIPSLSEITGIPALPMFDVSAENIQAAMLGAVESERHLAESGETALKFIATVMPEGISMPSLILPKEVVQQFTKPEPLTEWEKAQEEYHAEVSAKYPTLAEAPVGLAVGFVAESLLQAGMIGAATEYASKVAAIIETPVTEFLAAREVTPAGAIKYKIGEAYVEIPGTQAYTTETTAQLYSQVEKLGVSKSTGVTFTGLLPEEKTISFESGKYISPFGEIVEIPPAIILEKPGPPPITIPGVGVTTEPITSAALKLSTEELQQFAKVQGVGEIVWQASDEFSGQIAQPTIGAITKYTGFKLGGVENMFYVEAVTKQPGILGTLIPEESISRGIMQINKAMTGEEFSRQFGELIKEGGLSTVQVSLAAAPAGGVVPYTTLTSGLMALGAGTISQVQTAITGMIAPAPTVTAAKALGEGMVIMAPAPSAVTTTVTKAVEAIPTPTPSVQLEVSVPSAVREMTAVMPTVTTEIITPAKISVFEAPSITPSAESVFPKIETVFAPEMTEAFKPAVTTEIIQAPSMQIPFEVAPITEMPSITAPITAPTFEMPAMEMPMLAPIISPITLPEMPTFEAPAAIEMPSITPVFEPITMPEMPTYEAPVFEVPSFEAPAAIEMPSLPSIITPEPLAPFVPAELPSFEIPAFEVPSAPAEVTMPAISGLIEMPAMAPAYEAPVFELPKFEAPAPTPIYEMPSFEAPAFEVPSYEAPSFAEAISAPALELPRYEAPEIPAFAEVPFAPLAPFEPTPAFEFPTFVPAEITEAPSLPSMMEVPAFGAMPEIGLGLGGLGGIAPIEPFKEFVIAPPKEEPFALPSIFEKPVVAPVTFELPAMKDIVVPKEFAAPSAKGGMEEITKAVTKETVSSIAKDITKPVTKVISRKAPRITTVTTGAPPSRIPIPTAKMPVWSIAKGVTQKKKGVTGKLPKGMSLLGERTALPDLISQWIGAGRYGKVTYPKPAALYPYQAKYPGGFVPTKEMISRGAERERLPRFSIAPYIGQLGGLLGGKKGFKK